MTSLPASPARRNRGRILLVAALAISLLFNAMAVGAVLKLRHLRQSLLGEDSAALMLPPDLRADIRRALVADGPNLNLALARVVAARKTAVALASASPFDPAATDQAMTKVRGEVTTLMAAAQVTVLDELTRRAAN